MKERINRVLFDDGADFNDIDPVYLVKFCEEKLKSLSYKINEYDSIYNEIERYFNPVIFTVDDHQHIGIGNGEHPSELLVVQDGNVDERLRIDSSGNVGLGTSTPDALLHLNNTPEESIIIMKEKINRALFDSGANFNDIDPVCLIKFCNEKLKSLSLEVDEYYNVYKEVKDECLCAKVLRSQGIDYGTGIAQTAINFSVATGTSVESAINLMANAMRSSTNAFREFGEAMRATSGIFNKGE